MEKYCTNTAFFDLMCIEVVCREARHSWNPGGAYTFLGFSFKGIGFR